MSPGTGNRTTRVLGLAALATVVTVVVLGLVVTPPDEVQGDLVRLIYVHPAVSTWAFVAFGVTALASLLYFWPATRGRVWDQVAGSSAEVGVVFCVTWPSVARAGPSRAGPSVQPSPASFSPLSCRSTTMRRTGGGPCTSGRRLTHSTRCTSTAASCGRWCCPSWPSGSSTPG